MECFIIQSKSLKQIDHIQCFITPNTNVSHDIILERNAICVYQLISISLGLMIFLLLITFGCVIRRLKKRLNSVQPNYVNELTEMDILIAKEAATERKYLVEGKIKLNIEDRELLEFMVVKLNRLIENRKSME